MLLTAGGIFGIYASINLCWTLVIGTAGIFSLATYAIVGMSAFLTTWLSINLGLPWWMLPMIGMFVGLAFGVTSLVWGQAWKRTGSFMQKPWSS